MEATKQQQELSNLIDDKLAELNLPQEPSLLYDPVRYTLSLAGKRVRPYLTLVGCGVCGGDIEEAIPAALSIELLHNFTLLHDDIMDRAHTRRGEPSVYKKWDSNTAILSGDAMYAKAFKQLQYYGREADYSKQTYSLILDLFLDSAERVCEGQAYDLMFEKDYDVSIDQYLQMIEGKTAALISGAFAMGGAVARADEKWIRELQFIGRKVGIAFQIQDDLLDAVADPKKFGKKKGGDIVEGKKTYLTLLALQRSEEQTNRKLVKLLTSTENSEEEIAEVISIFESLDVFSDTKNAIKYHYQEAIDHLDTFDNSQYKKGITEFLNRLISRKY
ncbi:geranylgeranyl diphosphate synthase, type II [Fodinibius salinus]|uniref:Geranylgeranyl diphosphate synthase, type II n=1 Tax=Fodinibius salinus TaxID=860790 RepID=A0A5D3YQF3_9BACT|nr:polyprenyl synthetase family protein [Fodinibius salinus]TYP95213.1 geranylgeranyl diphosphate synthase, type II [Fodinibius salinus]